jgi:Zn-dependent protease
LNPETLNTIGLILVFMLAMSWHEAAHAWVADRLGDPTARKLGRITLNPLKHLDPFLSLILPALVYSTTGFIFGGAKPVPINPAYFKNKSRGFMLVALAGPGSNLLMAVGFAGAYVLCAWFGVFDGGAVTVNPYGGSDVSSVPSLLRDMDRLLGRQALYTVGQQWLVMGVLINVLLAVFNMIPLPPLDGSRVVGWILPAKLKGLWYGLDRTGMLLILVFILLLGGFRYVLWIATPVAVSIGVLTDLVIALDPLS